MALKYVQKFMEDAGKAMDSGENLNSWAEKTLEKFSDVQKKNILDHVNSLPR